MSSLTVVMTNWRRPDSFRRVLDAVCSQTVRPVVFAWNNHPAQLDDLRVAWRIQSSQNRFCWPRWYLAAQAETEFVASIDDDLLPADDRVLEDALAVLRDAETHAIVGPYGKQLRDGVPFAESVHVSAGEGDRRVDWVKGRLMVMRTESLRRVAPARPPAPPPLVQRCDDIIVSARMAEGKRGQHLVPAVLRGRFRDLPQDHAVHRLPGFAEHRAQAAEQFFDWKGPP